jgi:hypothetical protein
MKHQRFALLNLALFSLIVSAPLTEGDHPFAQFVFAAMFVTIMVGAVYAVGKRWHARAIVAPLAILAALSQLLELGMDSRIVAIITDALAIAALLSVILLLVRLLFSVKKADYETINAALCVYLLMGILWAVTYSMTDLISPGAFSYPLTPTGSDSMRIGGEHTIMPLYYSFVTMTTLGYGDVVPIGAVARVLAICQAILGQIYLVVIVARLVGLQVSGGFNDQD